jgi:hypothetical protein
MNTYRNVTNNIIYRDNHNIYNIYKAVDTLIDYSIILFQSKYSYSIIFNKHKYYYIYIYTIFLCYTIVIIYICWDTYNMYGIL